MDREDSVSPDSTLRYRDQHPVLPPWETRSVTEVPFVESSSPTAPRGYDPGSFAARPSSQVNHRPKLSASASAPCAAEYSSPVSLHGSSMPWKSTASVPSSRPTAVPPYEKSENQRPSYDRPAYEDPDHFKPTFRKTASQPAPSYVPQIPPTPPDSVSRSSLRSASSSPPTRPVSKALPGTMSSRASRNRSAPQSKTESGARDHQSDQHQTTNDQTGIGKRFKSAFRDIFKKDPIDDSQFERISDRHWTDEY
jgi:hypothetical protein